jgi:hypothetical protein
MILSLLRNKFRNKPYGGKYENLNRKIFLSLTLWVKNEAIQLVKDHC